MTHAEFLPKDRDGRLFRVVEECGEVLQMIGKAGRFGMRERHPDGGPTNVEALVAELQDLQGAIYAVYPDLLRELQDLKAQGGEPKINFRCVVCGGGRLELRGQFWCCTGCGGSYGETPIGVPVDQDAVP